MKLSTVIKQVRSGPLKSLSPKDRTDEIIVNFINLGLIDMYGRFQLRTKEAIITLRSNKVIYELNSAEPDITVDNIAMTDGDVLQLVSAYNEEREIGINDDADPFSIFTVGYDQLQVPYAVDGDYISVIYKAFPTLIEFVDNGNGDAVEATIDLPEALMRALVDYIGYTAFDSVDGTAQAEGATRFARYENSCKFALDKGLVPLEAVNKSISTKGFV